MNIRCLGCNAIYDSSYSVCRQPKKGEYMLIITKSRACFNIDGVIFRMPPDMLVLYDDSGEIEYSADEGPLVLDWLCFDAEGDSDFIDTLELTVNRPIRFPDSEFICSLMRNITVEFYSLNSRRLKMLDSYMRTLLVKVSDTGQRHDMVQQTSEPHYSALIDLREKIYRNPQMKWTVDAMAAEVNMSRSYFQHIYREIFGVSCIADVISGKIEKAKEILSETSCTVSQVASMCGYDNEEHFMRQFKKTVGVTPTKYRKQI